MLVDRNDVVRHYRRLVEASRSRGCSVLIFAASDPDSVCACKILTTLLQTDQVLYKVKPVCSYDDLARSREELHNNRSQLRSIVMINCGAGVDVVEFFEVSRKSKLVFYVFDSQRPVHLSNVMRENTRVVVFADADDLDHVYPEHQREYEDVSDLEDEEYDDLLQDEADAPGPTPHRRRGNDGQPIADIPYRSLKLMKYRNALQLQEYYLGSYWTVPAACQLYELCVALNKEDPASLWCALVGLTDLYIHERISPQAYQMLLRDRMGDVVKLDRSDRQSQSLSHTLSLSQDSLSTSQPSSSTNSMHIRMSQTGQIDCVRDFRFLLLRHWSLLQAMEHSRYVVCALKLWGSFGVEKMKYFLTELGIPLREARQPYAFMREEHKVALVQSASKCGRNWGLDELMYDSFACHVAANHQISAADAVHALVALMERPATHALTDTSSNHTGLPGGTSLLLGSESSTESDGDSGDSDCLSEGDSSESDSEHKTRRRQRRRHRKDPESKQGGRTLSRRQLTVANFWTAFDSLFTKRSVSLLHTGLALSKKMHSAIVGQAVQILAGKRIRSGGSLRYVIIDESQYMSTISRPLALGRLAQFLSCATREMYKLSRNKRAKPLVVACLVEERGSYMVAGVNDSLTGRNNPDRLRAAFQTAAEKANCRISHDGFDSSIIEVARDDLITFLTECQFAQLS